MCHGMNIPMYKHTQRNIAFFPKAHWEMGSHSIPRLAVLRVTITWVKGRKQKQSQYLGVTEDKALGRGHLA